MEHEWRRVHGVPSLPKELQRLIAIGEEKRQFSSGMRPLVDSAYCTLHIRAALAGLSGLKGGKRGHEAEGGVGGC